MTDITKRLREWAGPAETDSPDAPLYEPSRLMREAADEIERLHARIAELEAQISTLSDPV